MPKIKLTKSELKSQRDALKQFTRYLPTLLLKKQQLQLETLKSQESVARNVVKEKEFKTRLDSWINLFGDGAAARRIGAYVKILRVRSGTQNVAGVEIPVYEGVDFEVADYDLFIEEPWAEDAVEVIKTIVEIRAERDILRKQYALISQELRVTTQRVNLFEKVKIPESKENIRVIQIYLGDQQTAAVGRSKIAKRKLEAA